MDKMGVTVEAFPPTFWEVGKTAVFTLPCGKPKRLQFLSIATSPKRALRKFAVLTTPNRNAISRGEDWVSRFLTRSLPPHHQNLPSASAAMNLSTQIDLNLFWSTSRKWRKRKWNSTLKKWQGHLTGACTTSLMLCMDGRSTLVLTCSTTRPLLAICSPRVSQVAVVQSLERVRRATAS